MYGVDIQQIINVVPTVGVTPTKVSPCNSYSAPIYEILPDVHLVLFSHRLLREKERVLGERKMSLSSEDNGIVIIGAGIVGLATALALHRKGICSVVLERADALRSTGAAIGIQANGWRALDQLGVGPTLREKAIRLRVLREIYLDNGQTEEALLGKEEGRYLLRSDLLQALFDSLPARTVRFGCQIIKVKTDPGTSHSTLQFNDGSVAIAKILIGCDGVNSIVAESLKLKPTRQYPIGAVRGITNYPNGHGFSNDHIRIKKGNVLVGRVPVDYKIVYWYIARPQLPGDSEILGKPELIRQDALKAMEGCPQEYLEMVENSDDSDLSFTKVSYRAPWDLVLGKFRRGTVTVAGDAMHVMGPFLGQGGAAGLEDAVVLGRCLARELFMGPNGDYDGRNLVNRVWKAFDEYVKERRVRVARLSLQTYLTGVLVATSSTFVTRLVLLALRILFRNAFSHAEYDCGRL
ncbi:monooxygenase 1-like [Magnolia sinica]|uniref:monooxygenase 1-like n=1 Tax=Magnolia sinica TaxID=86752 RepID=UPI0026589042|nr:monooxygenase 1-like [Magnolia sinica]